MTIGSIPRAKMRIMSRAQGAPRVTKERVPKLLPLFHYRHQISSIEMSRWYIPSEISRLRNRNALGSKRAIIADEWKETNAYARMP